ncbi:MAG: lamin tail domain-containing protein [Archangium sp.]|nr:lamin tail domain-containing protein [Archangium sp.]
MNRTSTSLLVSAVLTLSACRIEKPATQVPAAPSVEMFTASATSVDRGATVTLTWKVTNGTTIELREASSGALAVPTDRLEGSFDATVNERSLFVLTARGPGGSDARAITVDLNDSGATELNFQALPPVLPGGQSTTLVWTAPGAQQITLTAGATPVPTGGQLTSGAVTVTPSFDTTYTLVADGQTKTLTVTVQPAVLTLVATPPALQSGEMVNLQWTAAGADRLQISSPGRGQLTEITAAAMIANGTFNEVAPQLPPGSFLTYVVTALKGTESMSKTVTVFVGSGLSIVRLDAPANAAGGLPYSVRWQTVAADLVQLKVDGAVVHQSSSAATAADGQFTFTAPTRDFTVELVATDNRGGVRTRVAQVDSVGTPTALTLMASPGSTTSGGQVTLTWSCPEARRIRIVDSDGTAVFSANGQRAETGTVDVYPNATTTYVATADNSLGSVPVTGQATVTISGGTPVAVTQTPRTALAGQLVNLTSAAPSALFVGFPHTQVLPATQSDFLDISQTGGTRVLESGANVTTVDLPFSTALFGVTQSGPLTISRAGWLAWRGDLVVNSSEVALPSLSVSAAPFLVAPYWDDLTLTANSAVFVQLVGDAPEQSLVVQWNRMQCGTTVNTEATFQVRIHQNGQTSFHYKTMTLNAGPSFSIGIQDGTRTVAVRSTAVPASNTALYFFSPVTQPEVRVQRNSRWGGFVKSGNVTARISQPASVVGFPLDLSISEFMFRPSPLVPRGQYLEIVNRTAAPLDLSGWIITSTTTTSSFTIPSLTVPANGVSVVGDSIDPAENDDSGVQLAWGSLNFARDGGALTVGTADASIGFTYNGPADGGTGGSIEVDPGPFINASGTATIQACDATRTFGNLMPAQRGSPGTAVSCFGYLANAIPVRFVDISATGIPLVRPMGMTAVTSSTTTIALASDAGTDPAPMAFGVRQPVISVSLDGWIFWGTTTSTNSSNKTAPTTTAPIALASVFWDDLEVVPATGRSPEVYWKRFNMGEDTQTPAPHWVIQWSHLSHFSSTTKGLDDLNFEAKLFEDGTIEYHYGTMASGSNDGFGAGTSATVWLENLAGNLAMFRNINQGQVQSNTAVRFTPAP